MESSLGSVELLLISVTGPQLSVVTGSHPDLCCDAGKGKMHLPLSALSWKKN